MPRGNGSREVVKEVDGLYYDGVSEKGIGLVYRYPRKCAILRLDSPDYEKCIMPSFDIRFPWSSKELSMCFEIAWRLVGSANAASANKSTRYKISNSVMSPSNSSQSLTIALS